MDGDFNLGHYPHLPTIERIQRVICGGRYADPIPGFGVVDASPVPIYLISDWISTTREAVIAMKFLAIASVVTSLLA